MRNKRDEWQSVDVNKPMSKLMQSTIAVNGEGKNNRMLKKVRE